MLDEFLVEEAIEDKGESGECVDSGVFECVNLRHGVADGCDAI